MMGGAARRPGSPARLFVSRRSIWSGMLAMTFLALIWLLASERYLVFDRSILYKVAPRPANPPLRNTGLSKAAVLVETRMTPALVPSILQFTNILGPEWPIFFFTSEEAYEQPESVPFRRALHDGRITVRFLPKGTNFTSHRSVSVFLTRTWLWAQLAVYDRVLIFQTDSVLCSNAGSSVDDFLEWDLIGAPIRSALGQGYNGGLSIRNTQMMFEIAHEDGGEKFELAAVPGAPAESAFEDQFFYAQAKKRQAHLPTEEQAKKFAVESVFYEKPLGYHQPDRFQKDRLPEILEWCPEVAILTKSSFHV